MSEQAFHDVCVASSCRRVESSILPPTEEAVLLIMRQHAERGESGEGHHGGRTPHIILKICLYRRVTEECDNASVPLS